MELTEKRMVIDYRKKTLKEYVVFLVGNGSVYKEVSPAKWRNIDLLDTTSKYTEEKAFTLLCDEIISKFPVAKLIEKRDILQNTNKKDLYTMLLNNEI